MFKTDNFKITATQREINDVYNHKRAFDYVIKMIENKQIINEDDIKKINSLVIGLEKNDYREIEVYIAGSSHLPPHPKNVKELMYNLIKDYDYLKNLEIYERISILHQRFESIHPFQDGNGRTGRLLMIYEFIKAEIIPGISLKEDRELYLESLEKNALKSLEKILKENSKNEAERIKIFEKIEKDLKR